MLFCSILYSMEHCTFRRNTILWHYLLLNRRIIKEKTPLRSSFFPNTNPPFCMLFLAYFIDTNSPISSYKKSTISNLLYFIDG
jgi:hypothetical protein